MILRLVSVNEQEQLKALKDYYSNMQSSKKTEAKIARLVRFGRQYFPGFYMHLQMVELASKVEVTPNGLSVNYLEGRRTLGYESHQPYRRLS